MQSLKSAPINLNQQANQFASLAYATQTLGQSLAHEGAAGAYAPPKQRPLHLYPVVNEPKSRRVPLPVRINRGLRTVLMALCGLAILGYGFDVAASTEASKLQEQARRLNEQNTELSAQLLRVISFQGIADCVSTSKALRVPEQVMIVKEVPAAPLVPFEMRKHHLPIISGY